MSPARRARLAPTASRAGRGFALTCPSSSQVRCGCTTSCAGWATTSFFSKHSNFGGDTLFDQLGMGIQVLGRGEPMSMYHWESDQEDFLVLSGEATLIIEGQERPLRTWDFVHCPPYAEHTIVGGPCIVLGVAPASATPKFRASRTEAGGNSDE